jgi:hypothetical protein
MGCRDTQIALLGVLFIGIPNGPAGWKRACLDAPHAANAFVHIYASHISVLGIHMERPGRTSFQTSRLYALPTLFDGYVIWKSLERVFDDLYPGERKILLSFMYQRARKHTGHTALAFLGIHEDVAARGGNRRDCMV